MDEEDVMIEVFEEQVGGSGDNLNIAVHNQQGHETVFRIKNTTQLGKVMDIYCSKMKYIAGDPPRRTVTFLLDGTTVQSNDTPYSVGPAL